MLVCLTLDLPRVLSENKRTITKANLRGMAFLKWNHKSESDSDESEDIQALLEEMERSTYLTDKRKASKDLIVSL